MNIPEPWNKIFILFSIISIAGCIVLVLVFMAYATDEKYCNWKYNYRWKHRFDKPPKAKCYCKDCIRYEPSICGQSHCDVSGMSMPEEGFCWRAYPKTRKQAEREEEVINAEER